MSNFPEMTEYADGLATAYDNRQRQLRETDRSEEAAVVDEKTLKLHRKALATLREQFGDESKEVAATLHNLAKFFGSPRQAQ